MQIKSSDWLEMVDIVDNIHNQIVDIISGSIAFEVILSMRILE